MKALSLLLLTVSSAFAQLTVSGPSAGGNDPRIISGSNSVTVTGSSGAAVTKSGTGTLTLTGSTFAGYTINQSLGSANSPAFAALVLSSTGDAITISNGAISIQGMRLSPPDENGTIAIGQKVRTTDNVTFATLTIGSFFTVTGSGVSTSGNITTTDGGNISVNGHITSDDSNIHSDGSGNLTAGSFVGPASQVADEGLSSYAGTIGTGAIIHVPSEADAAVGQSCEDAVTHVVKIKQ